MAAGEVRLLDFGIARLLQSGLAEGAQHAVRRSAFTPWYAAPEQFTAQPVTVATDVYSLGVLLYELLTGTSPYVAAKNSPGALEEAVLSVEPPLAQRCSEALGTSCASRRFVGQYPCVRNEKGAGRPLCLGGGVRLGYRALSGREARGGTLAITLVCLTKVCAPECADARCGDNSRARAGHRPRCGALASARSCAPTRYRTRPPDRLRMW